nr:protein YgfX [Parashewanella tropica]
MQRMAFLCFAALILSSFVAWPETELLLFNVFQVTVFSLSLAFLVKEFKALQQWKLAFQLSELGEFRKFDTVSTYKIEKLWVSDWFCAFYLMSANSKGKLKRVETVFVFKDMLPDSNYRHLSRILLSVR